jgi:putative lipoprotein
LRDKVLNIPTSFYLPPEDVDNLRTAAAELMKQSQDYQKLLQEFAAHPNPETIFAEPPPPDPKDGKAAKKQNKPIE